MTTDTTPRQQGIIPLQEKTARALVAIGGAATAVSTFLAWTWTSEFPGDLTVTGYPGGLQVLALVGALLTVLFTAASYGVRGLRWLNPAGTDSPLLLLTLGVFGVVWYTVASITVELNGAVNLEPGAYVAAAASLVALVGALGLPIRGDSGDLTAPANAWETFRRAIAAAPPRKPARTLPSWAELLLIVVAFGIGLYVFTYGIDTAYAELFVGFLIIVAFGFAALTKSGLIARLTTITTKHRNVTIAAAFTAAAGFPFTQNNDAYTSVGVNILVFATVALGLNVVVGLAGLLDLGYVAFLGVGAYTAALVSGSTSSALGIQFPFWAAALAGAAASLVFGVLIGAPTLRLRGDYLAIVTLGFGEIFRITMNNLNGTTGPDITNGPNGISNVPDLDMFGFNFGESHETGINSLGRFGNYYLLMLLFTAIVVIVFRRAGESRIGRAWVAIREDETAATAMGINGFRLKLMAFALGASLAGLAGAVQAHVTYSVTPDQFEFAGTAPPNSAFLLAAVILGGMGTVSGPLIGASLLYLIPVKLQFMHDYQLLLFGLALILLMRFRPEGLVVNRRSKLEYHETDQLAVPKQLTLADANVDSSKAGA
ncbi:branched-chain amino acid ABC transporter permease [Streptomyces sp. H39-S7]|uniref:branched-chain amino acid ABC transporter permease n=1 Tax=Streptomyces sp. H39-S7 TaxID=3004357 RepID=UPI0022AE69DB|nr:branched-chain amino acid ABC transporter permease [Streptomyces sp. H39-S7]MCZ4121217.1 branched-chain amino acid ABC transporter permease [Streptomyces sp. H39-S7]